MPYKHAYLWVGGLVPFIALAFWPAYFGNLGEAPWAFHVHGITASLWVALLIAQSWLIHHRRRDLHKLAGRASLLLIPAFLVGGFAVVWTMVHRATPLMEMYRNRLAVADLTTNFAFAGLCWAGLRNRRHVQLHARYLLATVLFLIMPITTRLFSGVVPGLTVRGPEDLWRFGVGFHISGLIALAVAVRLYLADPAHGRPILVAIGVLVFQSVGFEWIGRTEAWLGLMNDYATLPPSTLITGGLALGTTVVVLGWSGAPTPGRPTQPVGRMAA